MTPAPQQMSNIALSWNLSSPSTSVVRGPANRVSDAAASAVASKNGRVSDHHRHRLAPANGLAGDHRVNGVKTADHSRQGLFDRFVKDSDDAAPTAAPGVRENGLTMTAASSALSHKPPGPGPGGAIPSNGLVTTMHAGAADPTKRTRPSPVLDERTVLSSSRNYNRNAVENANHRTMQPAIHPSRTDLSAAGAVAGRCWTAASGSGSTADSTSHHSGSVQHHHHHHHQQQQHLAKTSPPSLSLFPAPPHPSNASLKVPASLQPAFRNTVRSPSTIKPLAARVAAAPPPSAVARPDEAMARQSEARHLAKTAEIASLLHGANGNHPVGGTLPVAIAASAKSDLTTRNGKVSLSPDKLLRLTIPNKEVSRSLFGLLQFLHCSYGVEMVYR